MTMNFNIFGKKSVQNNVDYKSRLEYKLYLARENPEPVFDLSECSLKAVPSGIYSLCKVFRKEKLLLQINQLTTLLGGGQLSDLSLLTALNLHNNRLTALPEDIQHLTNLQELNISFNELKKLPEGVGCLVKLRELNCYQNKLRCLPACLGQLTELTCLDVRNNPGLLCLPPSLSQASGLQELRVHHQTLQDPPPSVACQGTTAILSYLSQKNGTKYIPAKNSDSQDLCKSERRVDGSCAAQDSFVLLGKKKQEKLQEFLEVERSLQEQKGKEFELHENMKLDKDKLLLSLKEHQKKLEGDVTRFQNQKEQERTKLLNHLLQVESQAEQNIADLLAINQALHLAGHWQDQERRDLQQLHDYKAKITQLRRREVIDAMESLLTEECSRKEKLLAYEKSKAEVIQNSLSREVEWSEQVCELLSARNTRQSALLSAVEADTEVQKALVAALLQRSDLHTHSLLMQVALVEQQLAVLTAVELQRRNVHSQEHMNDLAEKRKTLSEMLVELLQEQRERQRHLVNTLQQMDMDRQLYENSTDYWLRQYQRLLDTRPAQLTASMEPALVHQLVAAGVAHCLPFLACCHLPDLTLSQLSKIGVSNEDDRLAIIQAVNAYFSSKNAQCQASAPPQGQDLSPSAPPDLAPSVSIDPQPECVVCMELKCAVVFVPCGHLCTCFTCATQLVICPLCRATLQRKIHVFMP